MGLRETETNAGIQNEESPPLIAIPYQRAILNCRSRGRVADFARLVGHSPARLSRGGVHLG